MSEGGLLGVKGLAIAVGGGLGALARAWLSARAGVAGGLLAGVPLGTLWANYAGSLLLGVLVGLLPSEGLLRPALTTGLMGGLTTFSTLSLESALFFQSSGLLRAGAHLALHCVGGVIFAVWGLRIGASFVR